MVSDNNTKILTSLETIFRADVTYMKFGNLEDTLLNMSIEGDTSSLSLLLLQPDVLSLLNSTSKNGLNAKIPNSSQLYLMLILATRAGHASTVELLLSPSLWAPAPMYSIVDGDLVLAAIESNSIEVFQKYIDAFPQCVSQSMGHNGDPLNQAVWRTLWEESTAEQATSLAKLMLENGADVNGCGGNSVAGIGTGYDSYLCGACHSAPIELIELLLDYGATVKGSGAIQMAVVKERLDVLEILVKNGALVNEKLPVVFQWPESIGEGYVAETPLQLANRAGASKATKWLKDRDASET